MNATARGIGGTRMSCALLLFPELNLDFEMVIPEVTQRFLLEMSQLEPHGMGNPAPTFAINNLMLQSMRVMKEKHLRLVFTDGEATITALWWNAAQHADAIEAATVLHIAGRPEINEWAGKRMIQFSITDVEVQ